MPALSASERHQEARSEAASGRGALSRDLPRPPHLDGARRFDRDLFPAGARRAFALAPGQRRRRSGTITPARRSRSISSTAAARSVRTILGPDLAAANGRKAPCPRTPLASRRKHRRLDAGRLHGRAGLSNSPGFELARERLGTGLVYFRPIMSLAASRPPPRPEHRRQHQRRAGDRVARERRGYAVEQERRHIGDDAQNADVAALHADDPKCRRRHPPDRCRAPQPRAIAPLSAATDGLSRTSRWQGRRERCGARDRSPRPHRSAPRRSGATAPNTAPR